MTVIPNHCHGSLQVEDWWIMIIIFWPFIMLWKLLTFLLRLTGRIIAACVGFVLMVAGLILTVVIVAAPIGIPLMIFGILLLIRSVF